jgi:hypothetical protein
VRPSSLPVRCLALLAWILPLALAGGCATGEVHLWPVVDIEKKTELAQPAPAEEGSKEAASGYQVRVLWPIFELDTTGQGIKHAVRPLYSYDGVKKRGSILWPVVFYGFRSQEDRYLALVPLYFGGREGKQTWKVLFPLAGRFEGADYRRYFILPFLDSQKDDAHFRGLLLPPLLFGKDDHDHSRWGVILNYLYGDKPGASHHVLFPIVFHWSEVETNSARSEATSEEPPVSCHLLMPPIFYRNTKEAPSGRLEAKLYLLPLYCHSWGPQRQRYAIGVLPWMDFEGVAATSLLGWSHDLRKNRQKKEFEAFPFYASGRDGDNFEYKISGLGLSCWRSEDTHLGVPGRNRGWAWWPVFGHATGIDAATSEPNDQSGWRALGGLTRYTQSDSRYNLALLWPVQEISRKGGKRHNRFWPLYRYSADERKTEFIALAEIFSYRRDVELRSGIRFLLHPVSYQRTEEGDHDFRFLWKLVESRAEKGRSITALNPLFYHRSSPEASRDLILSGLLGCGRDGESRFIRLFWFVDIPLPNTQRPTFSFQFLGVGQGRRVISSRFCGEVFRGRRTKL